MAILRSYGANATRNAPPLPLNFGDERGCHPILRNKRAEISGHVGDLGNRLTRTANLANVDGAIHMLFHQTPCHRSAPIVGPSISPGKNCLGPLWM
jgi:hypothetical protein